VKIKDQDQQVTNSCQLISIKGQGQASGLRRKRLLLELENQCGFELWIFEWENAVDYCYSTLFVSKLGDDNFDIQCAICSKLVNFYAPGMVKTWGPQHFPVLIPYLPRTKPVFSNFE